MGLGKVFSKLLQKINYQTVWWSPMNTKKYIGLSQNERSLLTRNLEKLSKQPINK